MSELGAIITNKREEMQLSYEDLYNKTKIRTFYLQSIENGNFEALPGVVYLKGFLRTIARELELDYDTLMELYETDINNQKSELNTEDIDIKNSSKEKKRKSKKNYWWLILVFIAISAAIAYYYAIYLPNTIV